MLLMNIVLLNISKTIWRYIIVLTPEVHEILYTAHDISSAHYFYRENRFARTNLSLDKWKVYSDILFILVKSTFNTCT